MTYSADRIEPPKEKYHDIDGNPCSLFKLIRMEPEWAESRIRTLQADLAHAMTCDGLGQWSGTGWPSCPRCQDIRANLDAQKPTKEG